MPKGFDQPGGRISAAEISRNFGHWQDVAASHPVLVTHHGRPRVVLMSASEYFALSARGEVAPDIAEFDLGMDGVTTLAAHLREGFVWLDRDLRIRGLNAVAAANMGLDADAAMQLDFENLARENEAVATLVSWMRRVLRTAEAVRFEMTGVNDPSRIYTVCIFPFRGGLAYTFLQVTELHELRRASEVWRTEHRALNDLCEISIFHVNPMGFFSYVNDYLCHILGFSRSDLERIRLIDVCAEADREETARTLNTLVCGTTESHVGVFNLMMRTQGICRLKVSCAPIRRDGACIAIAVVGVEI
jgi:prevent-host-death family protein